MNIFDEQIILAEKVEIIIMVGMRGNEYKL